VKVLTRGYVIWWHEGFVSQAKYSEFLHSAILWRPLWR